MSTINEILINNKNSSKPIFKVLNRKREHEKEDIINDNNKKNINTKHNKFILYRNYNTSTSTNTKKNKTININDKEIENIRYLDKVNEKNKIKSPVNKERIFVNYNSNILQKNSQNTVKNFDYYGNIPSNFWNRNIIRTDSLNNYNNKISNFNNNDFIPNPNNSFPPNYNNTFNKTILNNYENNINNNNNYNIFSSTKENLLKPKDILSVSSTSSESKVLGDYIYFKDFQIGSGSFGEVLYGIHKTRHLEVAVKILSSETSSKSVNNEINFSKILANCQGFPLLYHSGVHDQKNIMIESLLGPSLDKLFKYCDKKFTLKTVCLVGKEVVNRLESMHKKGLLHRDLKPNNLTWGNFSSRYKTLKTNNTVNITSNNNIITSNYFVNTNLNEVRNNLETIFLIDFGLSCTYLESMSQKHYKYEEGYSFVGTLRYASLNSHKGTRQSRRDDLESMMYILIYFLKGKLPWQDIKAKQKQERQEKIMKIKSETKVDELCEDLPEEFAILLRYAKQLRFEETPSYVKFEKNFQNVIDKLKEEENVEKKFNYIWEKLLFDNYIKTKTYKDDSTLKEAVDTVFKGYPIDINDIKDYIEFIHYYYAKKQSIK